MLMCTKYMWYDIVDVVEQKCGEERYHRSKAESMPSLSKVTVDKYSEVQRKFVEAQGMSKESICHVVN